ncbi:hypothetical protein [Niallia sp. NCCP-28]|uniref:hypothetical protein n=1 Tax=Niallia sp. NCCP-28 TaxID=2934712 RepID=UPI00207DB29E|nr:hypothetical protein [Niallia sp. NCCP-28]GKU82701.1 hypothetical protein NCCP28_20970 [Niallia sp. NCCP-28]
MKQLLWWGLLILPWFLLLFFDKNRIKRFFPVLLLSIVLNSILYQLAEKLNWFFVKENLPFLTDITPTVYGMFAVGTLLIFYFNYGKFWLYFIVNLLFDIFQSYVVTPFYGKLGLFERQEMNGFESLLIMTLMALIFYLYQKWQDTVMLKSE